MGDMGCLALNTFKWGFREVGVIRDIGEVGDFKIWESWGIINK